MRVLIMNLSFVVTLHFLLKTFSVLCKDYEYAESLITHLIKPSEKSRYPEINDQQIKTVFRNNEVNFLENNKLLPLPSSLIHTLFINSQTETNLKDKNKHELLMNSVNHENKVDNVQAHAYPISEHRLLSEPYENCWDHNTGLRGTEIDKVSASTIELCQNLCFQILECTFFSYVEKTQNCVFYKNVYAIKDSAGVSSGPKSCVSKKSERQQQQQQQPASTPLVAPTDILTILRNSYDDPTDLEATQIDSTTSKSLTDPTLDNEYPVKSLAQQELYPPPRLFGGILGELLGGVRRPLSAINQISPESIQSGVVDTLSSAEALLAAGNTAMKTLPIFELLQAGNDLMRAGIPGSNRAGAVGGVSPLAKTKADATAPPTGVGQPEVTCLTEGMRCCVPRIAAVKYQTNPPKLNGINKQRCKATYFSQKDQLCVTAKYADEECETFVLETSTMYVYRNVMELPGKTMNNAICECMISKLTVEPDIPNNQIEVDAPNISGSGKWQYSLVAQDEEQESMVKVAKAVERFEDGTRLASKFATSYMKNLQKQTGEALPESPKILDALAEFGTEVKQFAEVLPIKSTTRRSNAKNV